MATFTCTRAMTAKQLKAQFIAEGITISDWADAHGYDRDDVYKVIAGIRKGTRGKGHEIAVRLGLKVGSVTIGSAAA